MAAMPAKIVRRRDRNTSDPDRLMIAFVEGKERLVEQNEDDVAGRKQCVYEEVTDARCSYPLGKYSSPAVRHRTPVGGVDVTSQNHQRKVAIEVGGRDGSADPSRKSPRLCGRVAGANTRLVACGSAHLHSRALTPDTAHLLCWWRTWGCVLHSHDTGWATTFHVALALSPRPPAQVGTVAIATS